MLRSQTSLVTICSWMEIDTGADVPCVVETVKAVETVAETTEPVAVEPLVPLANPNTIGKNDHVALRCPDGSFSMARAGGGQVGVSSFRVPCRCLIGLTYGCWYEYDEVLEQCVRLCGNPEDMVTEDVIDGGDAIPSTLLKSEGGQTVDAEALTKQGSGSASIIDALKDGSASFENK
ncbi:hypothetical protein KIPB_001736, partial [Kipferlia bialata]|eukprot:g1736.t1